MTSTFNKDNQWFYEDNKKDKEFNKEDEKRLLNKTKNKKVDKV